MRKNASVRTGASKPAPQAAPAVALRPSGRAGEWRRRLLPVAGLWLVTLAAYSNSFSAALVFDNAAILGKDPRITAVTAQNLHLIWTAEYWYPNVGNGLFRPLTTLSYLFNYAVLGDGPQPAGYHWVNYLLHAVAVTLLYLLGLTIFRRMAPALALAAVWAVHPVLTESITNVVGRADILAGCGVLGALLCHIRATAAKGRQKQAWLAGVALATGIGIFSKESAATVVGLALLYDLAFQGEFPWRSRLPGYGAMALAGLAYLAVRPAMPAPHFPFTDNPIVGAGFVVAKLTAVKVIGKYLWLLAWPARLSCDYSYRAIPRVTGDLGSWENWKAVVALAACLGVLGLAVYGWRRNRPLFFFASLFFVALAPTSNLVVTFGTIMAERLLYLPAIGFAGCLVLAVEAAAGRFARARPMAAPAVLAVICLALAARTWARNLDWQSEHALWSSAVEAQPDSYKTHQTYAGTGLLLDDAIGQVSRALEIVGEVPDALAPSMPYINAGQWYRQKGDELARTAPAESAAWYAKSLDVLQHAERIVRASGGVLPELDQELGRTYLRTGDFREAAAALERAVHWRLRADLLEDLSSAYYRMGDLRGAEIALIEGLVMHPDNARFVQELMALYNRSNPGSCAVVSAGATSSLDPNCPLVHEQLCTAASRILDIYVAGGLQDLADQTRASMAGTYGCPVR
jgi:tetratricopeptide (TPR) repeat protein